MIYYIIISALILLFVVCSNPKLVYSPYSNRALAKRKKTKELKFEKRYLFFVLALLVLLTGLRDFEIGNDTTQYVYFFEQFKDGNFDINYRIEFGFQLICFLIGRFTSDAHVFLFIYSTICYLLFGYIICKRSRNIPLSLCMVFFLFFTVYTNILRQGLVILLLLLGIDYLRCNKYIKASLFFIISGFIHFTGFFLLILLLFKFFPRKKTFYFVSFFVVLILSFSNFLGMLVGLVAPQYYHYFSGQYDGTGFLAVFLYLLIGISIFIVSYKCYYNSDTNEAKLAMVCNYLMVISFAMSFSLNLLTRVAQYFLAASTITLPNAISTYKNKKLWSIGITLILMVYFFLIVTVKASWNNIYPYHFFWE